MERPSSAPPIVRVSMLGHGGLTRQKTLRKAGKSKTLVVAVDGSRMSFRAVKLAAWLCDGADRVKTVCVPMGGLNSTEAVAIIKEAEQLLKMCGVPHTAIVPGQVIPIAEGATLTETLCHAAKGGHLLLGAGGKRISEAKGGQAANAVGSVSLACMRASHAPVILAKPKGTPKLDTTHGMEQRASGAASNTTVIAVDGSWISQKCFDMAVRFVKAGDEVIALHLVNTDVSMTRQDIAANSLLGDRAIASYYENECAKATMAGDPQCNFRFATCKLERGGSVAQTILDFTESVLADLVILGSIELGKPRDGADAIGSVCDAVARKTAAHVLVAKHFAS